MAPPDVALKYPRRRLARALCRLGGRLALRILTDTEVIGVQRFPAQGPLLVVGNHSAVMEVIMMVVLAPWPLEMLGSIDVPHERVNDLISRFYGYIPIRRGRMERASLQTALNILKQGGILGIFPEGGIWHPGAMRAQSGVAWLSLHGNAPVLPIGFSGARGALNSMFKRQRPRLKMHIGELIPALKHQTDKPRKALLAEYAQQVMEAVYDLLPEEERQSHPPPREESFALHVSIIGADGKNIACPPELTIQHATALARFLHQPAILKIFDKNLKLPVEPLKTLHHVPEPAAIAKACQAILAHLTTENPFLLSYRFGAVEAENMQAGIQELYALSAWAQRHGAQIQVTPIYRYKKPDSDEVITQVVQGNFENWM